MTSLALKVRIAGRFQRSVRIDTDGADEGSLRGYFCPPSSQEILKGMSRHAFESSQTAFTWTGPYGSGKSSLALALGALLSGNKTLQRAAEAAIGKRTAADVQKVFLRGHPKWTVVPVIGRRESAASVIGEALKASGLVKGKAPHRWTDQGVVDCLRSASSNRSAVLLIIDEMGKFLEGAAQDGADIYLFQLLAETAARSAHRLVVIGILHQAFEEYANKVSRATRDEWAKIQGRYVDFPLNASGEEQIELLARAIESDRTIKSPGKIATGVADVIKHSRPNASTTLPLALETCWPLHPVVACLLGPISRRRFGQNQRSVFGFLNSREPAGFQDFLKSAGQDELYAIHQLWDYLKLNLEPVILASPDGHRWASAAEAVHRCEMQRSDSTHINLLKTIAVIDLFKDRSGITASLALIRLCFPNFTPRKIQEALNDLIKWSLVIFRKHADSYATFAGSDFDVDRAVERARELLPLGDIGLVRQLAPVQPIVAKRHLHHTGALRWCDVELVEIAQLREFVRSYTPTSGAIGAFVLAIASGGESDERAATLIREAARESDDKNVMIGLSPRSWELPKLARELKAIEKVKAAHPELAGDAVARREVNAREAALQVQLDGELRSILHGATWYLKGHSPRAFTHRALSRFASDLADKRFSECPRLPNELLNRVSPSVSAVAALNILLRAMVQNERKERLGMEGYPAEAGLYESLLLAPRLHAVTEEEWGFVPPSSGAADVHQLRPLWTATEKFLQGNGDRLVPGNELCDLWRAPPFGLKEGLMPVLLVAFVLAHKRNVAVHRAGMFQPQLRDLDVEYLARDPADVQLRWMDLTSEARDLLAGLARIIAEQGPERSIRSLEPFDVARGLVATYEQLPPWTKRTTRLSGNALKVRELLKHANDPNKLIFEDIPRTFGITSGDVRNSNRKVVVELIRSGLLELTGAYPGLLKQQWAAVLAGLRVPNESLEALRELKARAENIRQVTGDFRLEAFIGRIATLTEESPDVEGLGSLSISKPSRDWTDPDVDRLGLELSDMARRFVQAEAFAHVRGRKNKRNALAIVVGLNGDNRELLHEFDVTDKESEEVLRVARYVENLLNNASRGRRHISLAALAQLAADYIRNEQSEPNQVPTVAKHG